MARVVVGMSGGVDSAVAAYLLKIAGHEVIGLTLRNWVAADGSESRCCEIDEARQVSDVLGIPYYVQNCFSEFDEHVITPFIDDYLNGRTPNPCVICNRAVKWKGMLAFARQQQADYVATGHYASVVQLKNGRYTVQANPLNKKDQTYMLYRLTQEQLAVTLMPLGKLNKDEVRDIADKAGLPVAKKADSLELCFVPDDDYARYIEENAKTPVPGEGNYVNKDGQILGTHKGITHYTIGQRKGLGIALGERTFVTELRPDTNEVVLGKETDLLRDTVLCHDVNFQSIPPMNPGENIRCRAKIRYHHQATDAEIMMTDQGDLQIHFDEPVKAATPGQSAVFYDDNNYVIGGGIIN